MDFHQLMEWSSMAIELLGVAVLTFGTAWALVGYALHAVKNGRETYRRLRHRLGRVILLGLEILIVADIIRTVTVEFTVTSAVTLGLIVLVRTFLSFSLEIELEGVVPWRRYSVKERNH